MLLLVFRVLCLSLCVEAVVSQLLWDETKTTFSPHYESTATHRNAQSRRWRPVSGEDNGGTHGARAQATGDGARTWPGNTNPAQALEREAAQHTVRKSDAPNGAQRGGSPGDGEETLRTDGNKIGELRKAGCSHLKLPEGAVHPRSTGRSRQRRNAKHGEKNEGEPSRAGGLSVEAAWEALPEAMAQEQAPEPPFNETDYEEFTVPDLPDSTPFVPVNTQTRRKPVRNPFYPVTAESYGAYAVMIIAVVIFTVGIIGNVAVMCIVCHNYYMRSISNSLLANMALWDFLIIFFCLPLVVFHELTRDWLLGEFCCRIIPYLEVASLGVTTFTLCALCIDRFRAATNVQMYYEMIENCASTAAKLAVIWIGALLLALPELLIRQLVTEDGDPPNVTPCERCVVRISTELPDTLYVLGLTYDGARLWWYFGCYFCLPTLFTICSSLVTARKIRQVEKACVRGNKKQIQLESQMNCTVVALAILYGFCIIPENICNIISVYMAAGVPRRTLDILHLVSQLLLFCKSAITPVLLFSLCQPFTRAFLDCCCCCCVECGPPRSSTTSDNENECTTTELELSPFSTIRREASSYTAVGTHC